MEVTRVTRTRVGEVDFENLEFGRVFSDHMFMSRFAKGAWNSPKIVPYGNIDIAPSLCTLHYGQTVFDGLKAYRTVNGTIALFRPDKYHARFNRSAARLCIPPVDKDLFMEAITEPVQARHLMGSRKERVFALHSPLHLRDRQFHRRSRLRYLSVHGHHLPCGGLLQGRAQPRQAHHLGPVCPGRQGRSGGSKDCGQLCRFSAARRRGPEEGLHPGVVARCLREPVHRGSGHHEHNVPLRRRARHSSPRRRLWLRTPRQSAEGEPAPSEEMQIKVSFR